MKRYGLEEEEALTLEQGVSDNLRRRDGCMYRY
jgi:hypothetical protein